MRISKMRAKLYLLLPLYGIDILVAFWLHFGDGFGVDWKRIRLLALVRIHEILPPLKPALVQGPWH
jgi:hypothetical protein